MKVKLGGDAHISAFEKRAEKAFSQHTSRSVARNAAKIATELLMYEGTGVDKETRFIYKTQEPHN